MEAHKETEQGELAKIVRSWDLAGVLMADYLIVPRPRISDATNYLILPLPEALIEDRGNGELHIDDELVSGNREFWETSLEESNKDLELLAARISSTLAALAALDKEELIAHCNKLAIQFGHLPGYEILPDRSPLKNAIDYIIENTEKEETP